VGDDALNDRVRTAVHDRHVAVNGDHPMTSSDGDAAQTLRHFPGHADAA
jgi:hypothetical protein